MLLNEITVPIKIHFDITTSIDGGEIEHTVTTSINGDSNDVVKHLLDTTKEQTKKALIKLGWTQPKE